MLRRGKNQNSARPARLHTYCNGLNKAILRLSRGTAAVVIAEAECRTKPGDVGLFLHWGEAL